MNKISRNKLLKIGLIFLGIPVLSYLLANLKIYQYETEIFVEDYWERQIIMLLKVYIWFFLGLLIYRLSFKLPFEKKKLKTSIPSHLLLSLVFAIVYFYLFYHIGRLIVDESVVYYGASFGRLFKLNFRYNILIYWAILGFCYTLNFYQKYQKREKEALELELKTARLEAMLATAQLQSLKMQIKPHFLYNTLHTISGLIYEDADKANDMISGLSELLRYSLEKTNNTTVKLGEEIEFIKKYLNIQKIRFKDRLKINIVIEPESPDAEVPAMILQPLVENAVEHGISSIKGQGLIKISTFIDKDRLIMEIFDNGKGIKSDAELSQGVGISNTAEQLNRLYPENHSFELKNVKRSGFIVRICIPFKHYTSSEQNLKNEKNGNQINNS